MFRRIQTFHVAPRLIDTADAPTDREWASVYLQSTTVTLTGHGPIEPRPRNPQSSRFTSFWDTWQCKYGVEGDPNNLCKAIQQAYAVAVSDGSFQDGAGVAAWTIKSKTAECRIKGAGLTPGAELDQSAYHSELFGLWGILFSLKRFVDEHQITKGAF